MLNDILKRKLNDVLDELIDEDELYNDNEEDDTDEEVNDEED